MCGVLLLPACSWELTVNSTCPLSLDEMAAVAGEEIWGCDPGASELSAEAVWDVLCSHLGCAMFPVMVAV